MPRGTQNCENNPMQSRGWASHYPKTQDLVDQLHETNRFRPRALSSHSLSRSSREGAQHRKRFRLSIGSGLRKRRPGLTLSSSQAGGLDERSDIQELFARIDPDIVCAIRLQECKIIGSPSAECASGSQSEGRRPDSMSDRQGRRPDGARRAPTAGFGHATALPLRGHDEAADHPRRGLTLA